MRTSIGTSRWPYPRLSLGVLLVAAHIVAQEVVTQEVVAQEVVVDFCLPEECRETDPGCCIEDTLEVVFRDGEDLDTSVLEFGEFVAGTRIDIAVVTETVSPQVQGWSYGVKHDEAFVSLIEESLTIDGTTAGEGNRGFINIGAGPGGWYSATGLSILANPPLPVDRRNTLAFASYRLLADPGTEGTLLELVSDEIRPHPNSPRVVITMTVAGEARQPLGLTQGLVRTASRRSEFTRGDADADGNLNISDAVVILRVLFGGSSQPVDCDDALDTNDDGSVEINDAISLLSYLFRSGPPFPSPFLASGSDSTADTLGCSEYGTRCAQ